MAFFDIEKIQAVAEQIRNGRPDRVRKIRVVHCGSCNEKQEHVYLWFRDVPNEFVGTRICTVCGFAPGQNTGVKDKELRQLVLEADHFQCVYCGATDRLVVDHIVPHAHGGEKVFENLLTACHSCNSRRNTKRTPVLRFGRFRRQHP